MTKEAFDVVVRMILKECCCCNDLLELCEYWEVTIDDFNEFFELARRGFEKKVQEVKEKGKNNG